MQVSINIKPDLIEKVDQAKGGQSRSAFIVTCIYEHFNPPKSIQEADITNLTTQLNETKTNVANLERRLSDKENEVEYLRQEYSKINDALSQRLLAETKPTGFWARLFGRSK